MKFYFTALCAALTLCVALALCVTPVTVHAAGISAAKVGEREISLEQVRALLPELSAQQREVLGSNPDALRQTIQAALLQQLLVRAARQAQWDTNPQVVDAMRRAQDAALAESFLEGITALPDHYPQETELRAVYEANKDQLMLPKQLQLSQIFVAEPQQAEREQHRVAEKKRKAISAALKKDDSAESFARLAREHSDERASAATGGAIGWLSREQIVPSLRQPLEGIAAGSVVGPIRLEGGWHWIRCNEVQEPQPVAFELVSGQLAARLRAERSNASRKAYLERLLRDNPIVLNELALMQLVRTDNAQPFGDASTVIFDAGTQLVSQP